MLAALLAALLFQETSAVFIGQVDKVDDEWQITLEGSDKPLPLRTAPGVGSPAAYKRRRVQVLGEMDGKGVVAKIFNELHPADKDFVFKIDARGDRAVVLEYLPMKSHRHAGNSCKIHAWTRVEVKARDGVIKGEVRIPAYKDRTHVRVFVRVEGPSETKESEEYSFNSEFWLDKEFAAVDKPVDIKLEAK